MQQTELREIRPQEREILTQFLARQGLQRDALLDYSAGIFDGDRLVATGSLAGNTLRCLAVDPAVWGQRLMGQIVEHLTRIQYARGNYHLFLYTKPVYMPIFQDLGYTEIVRDDARAVFMENRRQGFLNYLLRLRKESGQPDKPAAKVGAVVMHANPLTLGHRFLVGKAAESCDVLHVFVLSEEDSFFPAEDRMALVRQGIADIPGTIVHGTDSYLISKATFPAYFLADTRQASMAQAGIDAKIFGRIAEELDISVRFMGEEPYSQVTALYNQVTRSSLAAQGIDVQIVPRAQSAGETISASAVRLALKEGNWELVRRMVPDCTWDYLHSEKGEAVIRRITEADRVEHH